MAPHPFPGKEMAAALRLGIDLIADYPAYGIYDLATYVDPDYEKTLAVSMHHPKPEEGELNVDLLAEHLGGYDIIDGQDFSASGYVRRMHYAPLGLAVCLSMYSDRHMEGAPVAGEEVQLTSRKFAGVVGTIALPPSRAQICFLGVPRSYLDLEISSPADYECAEKLLRRSSIRNEFRTFSNEPPVRRVVCAEFAHPMQTSVTIDDYHSWQPEQ